MDEMNNMNETTIEEKETSVEVVPEENVQVNESKSDSETSSLGTILGLAGLGAAVVYGAYKCHKNKKASSSAGKPKTKKKFHLRTPFVITEEVETPEEETSDKNVEETSDEE